MNELDKLIYIILITSVITYSTYFISDLVEDYLCYKGVGGRGLVDANAGKIGNYQVIDKEKSKDVQK